MEKNLQKENIEDVYPMTDIEVGMVYHSLKNPGTPVYHNQMVYQQKVQAFAPERLKKAMLLLVEKHPILRTCFDLHTADEPVQMVFKTLPTDIEHYNISRMASPQQEEFVKKKMKEDSQKPFGFDINNSQPLWRIKTFWLGEHHICFLWICHHAILDGWSSASLMTELNNTYLKLKSDPDFVPEKLKNTYKEFVIEQMIQKEKPETLEYWKKELAGYKRLAFPGTVGKPGPPGESRAVGNPGAPIIRNVYTLDLGKSMPAQLNHAAVRYDTNLKHLCLGAYIYMLDMLCYEGDIAAGLVTGNRPVCEDGEKILGCFLNTVPVRVKIPAHIRWRDYIRVLDERLVELAKHDRLSLFEIARLIGEEVQDQNPIFDTMFNFVDFHIYQEIKPQTLQGIDQNGFNPGISVLGEANTNTLLDFHVENNSGRLIVAISYSHTLLGDEMVKRCCDYFVKVLNMFIREPEKFTAKDEIISLPEKQKLLYEFNHTSTSYPYDKTIHELFAEQAERTPDYIALVGAHELHEKGTRGLTPLSTLISITYTELNEKSNQLAHLLKQKGVKFDTIVGLKMERSIEMMVGIFAILKAGGAYMPIDPDYPEDRLRYMVTDSSAKILLTSQEIAILSSPETFYNRSKGTSSHLHLPPTPVTSLAYVIYTSGSTGKPKGVMIRHRSVINRLNWMQRFYPLGEEDVILQKTPIVFDVSVWELFWWSFYGASLCLLAPGGEKNPEEIIEALKKNKITTMHFVPSMLNAFLEYQEEREELTGIHFDLRQVFSSGEALAGHQVEKFNQLLNKHKKVKLINLYGPTEATVDVSYFNCPTGENLENPSIPIGKPIDNIQLYVVSKAMELQPIGVVGELCISGVGLARGYLNRPELTAEKFDHDLWDYLDYHDENKKLLRGCPEVSRGGFLEKSPPGRRRQKIYRTGDLARWLPDGNIEFSGRIDHQVKIRGFRIELGEIEHHLRLHPGIKEAVVILMKNEAGGGDLCAYVVSDRELTSFVPDLKEHLSRHLPHYMIPLYFVQIEEIPLTPNGKVDRKILESKNKKIEPLSAAAEYAAPEKKIEKVIANTWKEVLKIDKVGVIDNFFDIGGHSLNILKVNGKLRKAFDRNITIAEMFRYPTIRALAKYFSQEEPDVSLSGEKIDESVELLDEAANELFIDEIN